MKKTFHKILSFIFALALLSSALVLPAGALPEDGGHAVYSMRLEKITTPGYLIFKTPTTDASELGDVYRLIVSVETNAKLWWSNVFLTYDQTKLLPVKGSAFKSKTQFQLKTGVAVYKQDVIAADATKNVKIGGRMLGTLAMDDVYDEDGSVLENIGDNVDDDYIAKIDPLAWEEAVDPDDPGVTTDSEMEFNAIYKSDSGKQYDAMIGGAYPDTVPENIGMVQLKYAHNANPAYPVRAFGTGDLYEIYFRTVPGASADGAEFRFAYCDPSQDENELDFYSGTDSGPKNLATVTTNSPYTYTAPAVMEIEKLKSQVRFDREGEGVADLFDYRLITSISKPLMTELKANQNSLEVGFIATYAGVSDDQIEAAKTAIANGGDISALDPKWFGAKGSYIYEADDGHGEFGSRMNGISHECIANNAKDIVVHAYVKYTDAEDAQIYWLKDGIVTASIHSGYDTAVYNFLNPAPTP